MVLMDLVLRFQGLLGTHLQIHHFLFRHILKPRARQVIQFFTYRLVI